MIRCESLAQEQQQNPPPVVVYFGKQFGQGTAVIVPERVSLSNRVWFGLSDRWHCRAPVKPFAELVCRKCPCLLEWTFPWDKLVWGCSRVARGEASFWSRDSCFCTGIVLPLFVLVVLQSVLVVLQLGSGSCRCVLERPFVIYQLWVIVIQEGCFVGCFIILDIADLSCLGS